MMDNERHKNEYNELRKECLCRNRILSKKAHEHDACTLRPYSRTLSGIAIIGKDCKPDKYLECPLFMFVKKMMMR